MDTEMADVAAEPQMKILCCECGTLIEPNPSNTCLACLRSKIDITADVPKQVILYFCKGCERYQQAQGQWVVATLESRELLTLCLKKVKGLNTVRVMDASFIWTEPHSRRIKVKLVIQKEVIGGALMEQTFVVEFIVNRNMCEACHRIEAKDYWNAVTQVRQKVSHKKTFFYLEQLLIKTGSKKHSKWNNIKPIEHGLDFFFDKRDDARKLADFLTTVIPCRYTTSQRLISHDTHSNTFNYKWTYSVEIVPICKDDIVCLPLGLARQLGGIGQLCICLRVTNQIYLIDPTTLKTAEVNSSMYFKSPFNAITGLKSLVPFTVMDIDKAAAVNHKHGQFSEKHLLSDVWVVRTSELGVNDSYTHCKTHLGHLLNPGDQVLGFDMKNSNINDIHFNKLEEKTQEGQGLDVILVRKIYGDRSQRKRKRQWKLKRLVDADGSSTDGDFEDFVEDIEEDPVLRTGVNIYKDSEKMKSSMAVDEDEQDPSIPQISLQEMLDDLTIDDDDDDEGDDDISG